MPKTKIARSQKTNKQKVTGRAYFKQNAGLKVKTIKDMFKKKEIHHIAKETQFIQRQRKVDAYEFFFILKLWDTQRRCRDAKRFG